MDKHYQSLNDLIKKSGFREALSYKFLEFRNRYPLVNRLFSKFIILHANSGVYSPNYIAQWDNNGRLAYFNPNPTYPDDARAIDPETWQPIKRLTDEEIKKRSPIEFALTQYEIFGT